MAANMYRVGDYVYFETSVAEPYQVRRIEELTKTEAGGVEARVRCYYRRSDLSASLIKQAERCYGLAWQDDTPAASASASTSSPVESAPLANSNGHSGGDKAAGTGSTVGASCDAAVKSGDTDADNSHADGEHATGDAERAAARQAGAGWMQSLAAEDRQRLLEHRELFLSRTVDALPATQIRGKCSVTLLCEQAETADSYLCWPDHFFYSLVYDPAQKTLRVDEGEMRVGADYQADVPPWTGPLQSSSPAKRARRGSGSADRGEEQLMWRADCGGLSDQQIDSFVMITRSVGLFARALDSDGGGVLSSSTAACGLLRQAAAASRDVTLQHALDVLHASDYDLARAMAALVPPHAGPTLCRDQLELWSPQESAAFDRAYDEHGKQLQQLRQQQLPWKSSASVVQYFYMWKSSDRFVRRRRAKLAASDSQLKQVYIPDYADGERQHTPHQPQCNGTATGGGSSGGGHGQVCQGCGGAGQRVTVCGEWRLCTDCHHYWKRYGCAPLPGCSAAQLARAAARPSSSSAASAHRCPCCDSQHRSHALLLQHMSAAHPLHRPLSPPAVTAAGGAAGGVATPAQLSGSAARVRPGFLMTPSWLALAARRFCLDRRHWRRLARRGLAPLLGPSAIPASTTAGPSAATATAVLTAAGVRRQCVAVGVDASALLTYHRRRRNQWRSQQQQQQQQYHHKQRQHQQHELKHKPARPATHNGHRASSVSITLVAPPVGSSSSGGGCSAGAHGPTGAVAQSGRGRRTRRSAGVAAYDGLVFVAGAAVRQLRSSCSQRQLQRLARLPYRSISQQQQQRLPIKM